MITDKSLKNLPSTIGVYLFYQDNKPIYIGKSINIKARVSSHLKAAKLSAKEAGIINNATRIEYKTTISELNALLLEARLIKQAEPKYNVILKDDKHSLYIKITMSEAFPKIYPVRKENEPDSLYFGPFQSTRTTYHLISAIRTVIPFCSMKRIGRSACFYSKIGLCDPCPSSVSRLSEAERTQAKRRYRKQIRAVIAILSGKSQSLHTKLMRLMQISSKKQQFEEALSFRNRLDSLDNLLTRRSFLSHHEALQELESAQMQPHFAKFMEHYFETDIGPDYKIECFDLSTLQGSYSTGSRVVFENGEFATRLYRRYRIKWARGNSDIDMLQEVLKRRLSDKDDSLPTLLLIDGGTPQLTAGRQIIERLAHGLPYLGIAKRPDRVIFPVSSLKSGFIPHSDPVFKLFISLRDEAHRFAKKYHSQLRSRRYML